MHKKNIWNNAHIEVFYDFFLFEHITPGNNYMLKVLADFLKSFSQFFAFWVPTGPEKDYAHHIGLSFSNTF